jgi:hypothetical protein
MVAMSMNDDAMVLHLNPGFDIIVKVPFDVRQGTKTPEIKVHDSMIPGGASIKLS